jgi:glycosyltransferase involved in cell wall biosynthesis
VCILPPGNADGNTGKRRQFYCEKRENYVSDLLDMKRQIAFYAPIKPPDHEIPSGDRQMARMLFKALEKAGYEVFLASRFIAYSKRHGLEVLEARRAAAATEASRLISLWQDNNSQPRLWFCYHPYDKAPDWLGMELCRRLDIPMVTAEACKTGQGPNGEWLPWRAEAQRGIKMAALNLVMKPSDLDYLGDFVDPGKIMQFPPFIDSSLSPSMSAGDPWPGDPRLVSVAMMRPGAKLDSYRLLAHALKRLDQAWSLVIVGDGPCRAEVEELFGFAAAGRVVFAGERSVEEAIGLMSRADLLAWPGCREAYGMVYLEAATQGVPSVALHTMGVPTVVMHDRTGLLASPPTVENYAEQLGRLLADPALLRRLGQGAKAFVEGERSIEIAAKRLRTALDPLFEE